jgi:hypothetical protein
LEEIGKEVGTPPENIFDILDHIRKIKEMAIRAFAKGKEEQKRNTEKERKKVINQKVYDFQWLLQFLNLRKG